MRQLKVLQLLQATGKKVFSSADLQKLLRPKDSNYGHIQASRLAKEGVIERIMRGWYVLPSNRPTDFAIANAIHGPSYVSMESALNFYGILVQAPQEVTSVTIGAARVIKVRNRRFSYAHLTRTYFSEYEKNGDFIIATPEKALVDSMFFVALGRASLAIDELDMSGLDREKVIAIASAIKNKAFSKYFAAALPNI